MTKFKYNVLKKRMLNDINNAKVINRKMSMKDIDNFKLNSMSRSILMNVSNDDLIEYSIALRWQIAELEMKIEKANVNTLMNELERILKEGEE